MAGRARITAGPQAAGTDGVVPYAEFTEEQKAKVKRAADNGIVNPVWAMQAALWAPMPYYVLCAYLEQESARGENVWGHDDTWMVGYPVLNEDTYSVYKRHRTRFGHQGAGPMQLTSTGFQDRGDALGGCWLPLPNMQAAAGWMREQRDAGLDWHSIARLYNGSDSYADHNDELRAKWKALIL